METSAPANMTPAEIDAELARLAAVEAHALRTAAEYRRYADTTRQSYMVDQYRATADEAAAKALAARDEATPYNAEFARRGGWNRYFLVTNVSGHVHRGMNCGTCFPSTEYAWLVDLADCDEAAMVAEYGEMACTVCFPAAPAFKGFADGTSTHARRTQAEKDERAAAKAARDAAKAAKALLAPVRGRWSTVSTVASAKTEIRNCVESATYYGSSDDDDQATIERMTAALLLKGVTAEEIETLKTKAATKARKEMAA